MRTVGIALLLLGAACGGGGDSLGPDASADIDAQLGDSGQEIAPQQIALDLVNPGDTYHGLGASLVDTGVPTVTATDGKIVIIAISMSNGRIEFNRFIELYEGHQDVSTEVQLVNCAKGGNALERWLDPAQYDNLWTDCKNLIQAAGHQLDQVKVVWAKDANQFPDGTTLPSDAADYHDLVVNISSISQMIASEFPSVQAVFHSSRIYGGYNARADRGEPLSYEGGLAVNEVLRRYKDGTLTETPWLGWGPYIWADGITPNGAGILWEEGDYQPDRIHPNQNGSTKVADALHDHLMQFEWYR
jgi:hypothetical protein